MRHEGRLEARGVGDAPGSGVSVDWSTLSAARGRAAPRTRSPLLRAIGDARSVIDATGGFGVDAWTIAASQRQVVMIERSPIMAALLADALARATEDDATTAARMRIIEGDARSVLASITTGAGPLEAPEVVYLDPMFPPKRRSSALSSKEMQFLGALVGPDLDAAELLAVARRVARTRVVVKRPPHAEPLAPGAAFTIASKLLRFDVYHCGSPPAVEGLGTMTR